MWGPPERPQSPNQARHGRVRLRPKPRVPYSHGTTSIPHGSAAGAAIPARPGSSSATASPNSPPASRPPPTSCGVTCRSSTAGTAGKASARRPLAQLAHRPRSRCRAREAARRRRARDLNHLSAVHRGAAAGGGVRGDRRAGGAAGARLAAGGPEGGGGRRGRLRRRPPHVDAAALAARETASETAPAAPELAAEIQVTRSSDPTLRAAAGVPGRLPGRYR